MYHIASSDAAYFLDPSVGILESIPLAIGKVKIRDLLRSDSAVLHLSNVAVRFLIWRMLDKSKFNGKALVSSGVRLARISEDKEANHTELWVL